MKVIAALKTSSILIAFSGVAWSAGYNDGLPETGLAAYDSGWMDEAVAMPLQVAIEDSDRIVLAEAHGGAEGAGEMGGGGEPEISEECRKFAADPDADVGDILRAGCQPTLGQMSALMDNPLGNVAMLFFQLDFYEKKNPAFDETDTQQVYTGILQFPKKLGENWNLINRVIWTIPSVPIGKEAADGGFGNIEPGPGLTPPPRGGSAPINQFPGRTTGFGDMYYVALFSPAETKPLGNGKANWGLGFNIGLPTASEDILGTGKWLAGPSALAIYMGPKWKFGGLAMHYEDVGGSSNRADVSMTNLQYILYYSLSETFAIGAAPNIIANWEQDSGNKFTVPIGIGFVSTVNIGKVPFRFGAELHYSVVRPDDTLGTQWDLRWYVIPAAPSALFKWMQ